MKHHSNTPTSEQPPAFQATAEARDTGGSNQPHAGPCQVGLLTSVQASLLRVLSGGQRGPRGTSSHAGRHFLLPQQGREAAQVTSWTDPIGLQTAGAPQRHTSPGPGWPLGSLPGTGLSHPLEAEPQTEQVETAPFWDILEDGELGKEKSQTSLHRPCSAACLLRRGKQPSPPAMTGDSELGTSAWS